MIPCTLHVGSRTLRESHEACAGGYSIGSSGFFAASASELYNATTGKTPLVSDSANLHDTGLFVEVLVSLPTYLEARFCTQAPGRPQGR